MRIRRLAPIVPALLFWAGCTADTTTDLSEGAQPHEGDTFIANDAESTKLAEKLGVQQILENHPEFMKGAGDLTIKRAFIDERGEAHDRLSQSINGVPVFGGEAIVHLGTDGGITKVTDHLVRDISVDTTPALVAKAAMDAAAKAIGGWEFVTGTPTTDLQILRHEGKDHLTFRVQMEGLTQEGELSMPVVFIDAHTGDMVWQYDNLQTARNRKTYSTSGTKLPGTLVRSEGDAPSGDAVLDAAHDNAGLTYDFYFSQFGRDSLNNGGMTLTSTVHYSTNYVNAFWNGSQMVYGDGDGVQSGPLTVLDVVGHELTHGVTNFSSNLTYSGESGALNEAMSDIFGASIEAYRDGAVSGNTWKVGEECWTPGTAGDALRYMNDPAAAGDYDYYPTRYTGTSDNGGVHWNSGIANLAFYLMTMGGTHPRGKTTVNVPAIDSSNSYNSILKAAAIFYRANTVYLTASSNFADARAKTIQAATDLYGATAAASVSAAWDAVGVGATSTSSWTLIDSVGNLSASRRKSLSFNEPTPAGATAIRFSISGGSGDADLYVKYGSAPTTSSYDCRPYVAGNSESCTFTPAQSGTYYIMLYGYSAFSGVTLKSEYMQ